MNDLLLRAVAVTALAAGPAVAQSSPEALWASGGARFEAALKIRSGDFRPTRLPPPAPTRGDRDAFAAALEHSATLLQASGFRETAPALVAELPLAPLRDWHLKTRLHYVLNGRSVWFSGAFDRNQRPFVSVLVEGQPVRYFDVRALLNHEQPVLVGGQSYTLSLWANIFNRMKSSIVLQSDSGPERVRFTVSEMLDAVASVGTPVHFPEQTVEVYLSSGIDGTPMFAFIFGNVRDFHIFLVPESAVPGDKTAVFDMYNGKRVGLRTVDGRLQVFDNP